jgi:riboflavin kinase / FMN adenylyltransferase
MILSRTLTDIDDRFRHGALAIGNFDGPHLGHARIVERLLAAARRVQGPPVVFTFDPHPSRVLHPELAPASLCWTERKAELLAELGVELVVAYPTDRALLSLEARQFFDRIIVECLQAKAMVEGPNFFFGHNRGGNISLLQEYCSAVGISLDVVPPLEMDGRIVSSSAIRDLISQGRIERANRLLFRPYRIRGIVSRGAGRGTKLGFPTANVEAYDTLLPAVGIYAGRALVDGTAWPAAVSLGPNPTFDEGRLKVEVYLVGYDGWLYDRPMEVEFIARLRDMRRFDSAESLIAQMKLDVAETVRLYNAIGVNGNV